MNWAPGTRVHIVGVGGAGMSAVARYLHEAGYEVSGCDTGSSGVLDDLTREGIVVMARHDADHVDHTDVLLWSPAIRADHPERRRAVALGVTALTRPEFLAQLSSAVAVVGLTGTHGKTTATSMMVSVMHAAGRDVSRILGAPVRGVGANGHGGTGHLLLEVDESYGAFAQLRPSALGLLNIEADHLDHYGTLESLEQAFTDLVTRTTGPVVVWTDDPGAARSARASHRDVVSVGRTTGEWRVATVERSRTLTRATLTGPREEIALTLHVPGDHNVANAAVVAVLARSVGVPAQAVADGLAAFRGAPRRFDYLGRWRGADVVDDYAHLPGEIMATLAAARDAGYRRIGVVFQPHRYTRTRSIGDAFAPALDSADVVVVTDIYAAGEINPTGLTGEVVADALWRHGRGEEVRYLASLEDVAASAPEVFDGVDVLLLLGAGDVTRVTTLFAEPLQ